MPSITIGPPGDESRFPADCNAAAPDPHDWAGCTAPPQRPIPGLLVSVRSLDEARIAATWGADVVDVKEPSRGALGAADAAVWDAIAEGIPAEICLSAALGEACECGAAAADSLPGRFHFAKAGPAGLSTLGLHDHWRTISRRLPNMTQLVAVAYADHMAGRCPPPDAVLDAAAAAGIRWWLLDTVVKDGRSVVDLLGVDRLRAIDAQAHDLGIHWVLAGSLRRSDLASVADLRPSLIGVRGDVCRGGRSGTLDGPAIGHWRRELAAIGSAARDGDSN